MNLTKAEIIELIYAADAKRSDLLAVHPPSLYDRVSDLTAAIDKLKDELCRIKAEEETHGI